MAFGKTIKDLRIKNDMTQEKLAELLNISPQAVSRWETNSAMPDISLLPPLANLFNVTTDFLLGMDTYKKDLRKAEFDTACFEYWKHDDKEKNYQIAVKAVQEYPGNMEYTEWLASAEYYMAFERRGTVDENNEEEFNRLLDSAIKHYKIVLDSNPSVKLHDSALHGIVLSYHFKGNLEKAKEYALTEEDEDKRNELLVWCLEGIEKRKHCQILSEQKLLHFLSQLKFGERTLQSCNAIEQILLILFPDGNFQHYHNMLTYNHIDKAFCLCHEKRYDEVLKELTKAKYHAEQETEFDKQKQYQFTAPLFNLVGGEKLETDSTETSLDCFKASLTNNHCFDPIREREEFKALLK